MAGAVTVSLGLPDVYVQRRRRPAAAPRVRTDVAGFVGFEPRFRPGVATLDHVTVHVAAIEVRVDGQNAQLAAGDTELSAAPLSAGQARIFSLAAALPVVPPIADGGRRLPACKLVSVAGTAVTGIPAPPADDALAAAAGTVLGWTRVADAHLRREGDVLWLTVHPRTRPAVCEDWGDYLRQFGVPAVDGTRLGAAVRAFFANGGNRCHITTVRRPFVEDDAELDAARSDMVGTIDAGAERGTGIARLLLIEEVALVAAPDLHAMRPGETAVEVPVPPSAADADFHRCEPDAPPAPPATGGVTFEEPLYGDLDVLFATELAMLDMVAAHGLGVELVVSVPMTIDPATGRYGPPDVAAALAWRARYSVLSGREGDASFAAVYWPWLWTQEDVGASPHTEPPLGAALGIIARRDLERGPFVAPANERAAGVVATTHVATDDEHRLLYDASLGGVSSLHGRAVNVFRPFPTRGVELWGSRTLAADRCLRHLPVRRGLSAIERNAAAALADIVFEPNTPMLALRVTHMLSTLLLDIFHAGGLRGATPEQAFVVRCDETVNPPESVIDGRLVCEVGVAIAAPAEFIVFRLGRQDSAIEVQEQ